MVTLQAREKPSPEAVHWDGPNTNEGELLALCQRVAALDVWAPLTPGVQLTYEVREQDELHGGCSIVRDDGLIIVRVELVAPWLVFDLFRQQHGGGVIAPLFAATDRDLIAFYQVRG